MEYRPDRVIFLDVDGVLNRCGKSEVKSGLEVHLAGRLERVIEATGAGIVVSSTWRKYDHLRDRLTAFLGGMGAVLRGWTPVSDMKTEGCIYTAVERGVEIQQWLDANPGVTRFAIIDDDSDMAHLKDAHFKTESFTGLTDPIADAVVRHLNA